MQTAVLLSGILPLNMRRLLLAGEVVAAPTVAFASVAASLPAVAFLVVVG